MRELWGPISIGDWCNTPCLSGRIATEDDVTAGTAVFYIQGESSPVSMSLPCCAYQRLENGTEQPVVIVQAEHAPHGIVLGVRPLNGGNSICLATEVRLLPRGFEA